MNKDKGAMHEKSSANFKIRRNNYTMMEKNGITGAKGKKMPTNRSLKSI
jgi:hypothetical protein